jgi:uncharacterized membrane protein
MSKDNSSVYNILVFSFTGQNTAKEVVKQIRSSGVLEGYKIAAEAIVEQDPKGKVHINEPGKGGVGAAVGAVGGGVGAAAASAVGGSVSAATASAVAGSMLSLIGGPIGVLAWVVAGAVIGGMAGKYLGRPIATGDLEEIGKALQPDTSAFMLLLEDKDSEAVIKGLSGYNANVVTLTVGDELSGEIASYAAGAVTDE